MEKMPHLVEGDDRLFGFDGGFRHVAGFVADPIENGDIAAAQQAGDRAEAHIAHGIEQQCQGLRRRRLAARRRHGEIASAGAAPIALHPAPDAVLRIVARAAALAADIRRGGPVSFMPPISSANMGNSILT